MTTEKTPTPTHEHAEKGSPHVHAPAPTHPPAPVKEETAVPAENKTPASGTKTRTTQGETKTKPTTKGKAAEAAKNAPPPHKPAKKKGVKAVWVKKEKITKDKKAKEAQEDIFAKWKPVFWGRFGKKNLRTRKNPKYDKWRKPRGEDMQQRRDDGAVVDAGYRSPKSIRGIHPSGYREVMVFTRKDLEGIQPMHAARISGTIGRKKKIELIKYANEKKIHVLN